MARKLSVTTEQQEGQPEVALAQRLLLKVPQAPENSRAKQGHITGLQIINQAMESGYTIEMQDHHPPKPQNRRPATLYYVQGLALFIHVRTLKPSTLEP